MSGAAKEQIDLIVDSREQSPFVFDPAVFNVARGTLKLADYAVAGMQDRAAIERKSLSDLLGCIGGSRPRFERELAGLSKLDFAAVVIEAGIVDVLGDGYRSSISPAAVMGSCAAWSVRYRVPFYFCGSRHHAQLWTAHLLRRLALDERRRVEEVTAAASMIAEELAAAAKGAQ